MCGIFGWNLKRDDDLSRPVKSRLRTAASILALRNEARGKQSWGAYYDATTIKSVGAISRMRATTMAELCRSRVVMAHTRHATHGRVVAENAHPFTIGGVTGAHNGIVHNHNQLNKKYGRRFDVDSMHIFAHIAEGLEMDDIEAYGAIEFVDEAGELWLSRFNGGELSVASTDYGLFWSSLQSDLTTALRLAGIRHTMLNVRENALHHCTVDALCIYPDIGIAESKWAFGKWSDYKLDPWYEVKHGRPMP